MIEIRIFIGDDLDRRVGLLPNKPLVVGRSRGADVRLPDLHASRRHVRLALTAAGFSVEDLGSTSGTEVNGEPLATGQSSVVPLPCKVVIGRHRLEIGWADDSSHGSIWGDYEKGVLLGEGSFGQVFAAKRRSDGQAVAIKELAIFDTGMLQRFRREELLCEGLDHPNLVQILEVREDEGGLYHVMELIEGGHDLKDYMLAHGPLPVAEVLGIAEAVGRGLQAIHEAGLVHRDIKPANVMRTPSGRLKITDFGLARAQEGGQTLTQMDNKGMGTISYISPEQAIDARRVGPQSDLYSLGATLYQALTGSLPFPQSNIGELLLAITQGEPIKVEELRSDCPRALSKLIHRLLARDPGERFVSSEQMLVHLGNIRESLA